jgi:hypothetical protein
MVDWKMTFETSEHPFEYFLLLLVFHIWLGSLEYQKDQAGYFVGKVHTELMREIQPSFNNSHTIHHTVTIKYRRHHNNSQEAIQSPIC